MTIVDTSDTSQVKAARPSLDPVPHSWAIEEWPAHVYPGNAKRGRAIVNANRVPLLNYGGLARVGHQLVVLGPGYVKWLYSQSVRVELEYEVAANRAQHRAKRFGGRVG